jgi:hypothetical protein
LEQIRDYASHAFVFVVISGFSIRNLHCNSIYQHGLLIAETGNGTMLLQNEAHVLRSRCAACQA